MKEIFRDAIRVVILIAVLVVIYFITFDRETENYLKEYYFSKPTTDTIDLTLRAMEHSSSYWKNQLMYFSDMSIKDTITIDLAITYFTNRDTPPLPVKYIKKSIKIQNQILWNNESYLKINFLPIVVINGTPKENKEQIPYTYKGKVDISKYRYNANFWSQKYYRDNAINCMIYNDNEGGGIARSYGIPSTMFKMRLKAIHPKYVTFLHEFLHCLGLRHTHQYDGSEELYGYTSGDYIGDTPAVCPLTQLVNNHCHLYNNWKEIRKSQMENEPFKTNPLENLNHLNKAEKTLLIHNIMSYTYKPCRTHITKEQAAKILYTIITTQDLRNATYEYRKEILLYK